MSMFFYENFRNSPGNSALSSEFLRSDRQIDGSTDGRSFLKICENDNKKERNKAVYTTTPVAGGWAGAVLCWAGAVMIWAGALISMNFSTFK